MAGPATNIPASAMQTVTCNAKMHDSDTIELKNIDPDDISDVLSKVEKSFGFKFGKTELKDVRTFGELCEIILQKVQGDDSNDCTTQQAFYKLRTAIVATQFIDKDTIRPDLELDIIFPRSNRRTKIKRLQKELNIPIEILDIKAWLGWSIFTGVFISLLIFFLNWQYALSGLTFFILAGWTANKFFATELNVVTIRDLTEKIVRESYLKARRTCLKINKTEIEQIVVDLFAKELILDKEVLTKQATF